MTAEEQLRIRALELAIATLGSATPQEYLIAADYFARFLITGDISGIPPLSK